MNLIKQLLKNIVLSTITLYSVNLILNKIGIMVPMNIFSIGVCSVLGFPGLIMYIILVLKYYR